jgi:hypothetical protein
LHGTHHDALKSTTTSRFAPAPATADSNSSNERISRTLCCCGFIVPQKQAAGRRCFQRVFKTLAKQMPQVLVKAECRGDIRRLAVAEDVTFEELEGRFRALFGFAAGEQVHIKVRERFAVWCPSCSAAAARRRRISGRRSKEIVARQFFSRQRAPHTCCRLQRLVPFGESMGHRLGALCALC